MSGTSWSRTWMSSEMRSARSSRRMSSATSWKSDMGERREGKMEELETDVERNAIEQNLFDQGGKSVSNPRSVGRTVEPGMG